MPAGAARFVPARTLLIALPIQIVTGYRGAVAMLVWIPMAVFEVWLALWLIFKGVALHPAPSPIGEAA